MVVLTLPLRMVLQFRDACESALMFLWGGCEDDEVSVSRFLTWHSVQEEIVSNVARRYDAYELGYEPNWFFYSLSWCAGFMLGWLSALASIECFSCLSGC